MEETKYLNRFRPPSGNEFKNGYCPSHKIGEQKLKSFRPPSGNEFKN